MRFSALVIALSVSTAFGSAIAQTALPPAPPSSSTASIDMLNCARNKAFFSCPASKTPFEIGSAATAECANEIRAYVAEKAPSEVETVMATNKRFDREAALDKIEATEFLYVQDFATNMAILCKANQRAAKGGR